MAKWGEGDPRWIVEERPDATNVNNWHWTEKNASPWSQERIKELFRDVPIESGEADVRIVEVDKLTGEASANNRKGKLIFFYEWELKLKWTGKLHGEEAKECSGKITVPNLSEENDVSELDIQVTLDDDGEDGHRLKQIVYNAGGDTVRRQVTKYVTGLREEFSRGMILPKKDEPAKVDQVKVLTSGFNKKINMQPVEAKKEPTVGLKIKTTTIKENIKFQCTAQEFYDALTRVELVTAFTRGRVKCEAFKGGNFELFGGNIVGSFVELVPCKKIQKRWRYKQWPDGVFSDVTILIEQKEDHTMVSLEQTGVPDGEAETVRSNWQRYYWEALKQTFGFGSFFQY